MEAEKKERILQVLTMISEDAEKDVMEFEGKPFTGRSVATFNGKQNAMIKTLTDIVKEVLLDQT